MKLDEMKRLAADSKTELINVCHGLHTSTPMWKTAVALERVILALERAVEQRDQWIENEQYGIAVDNDKKCYNDQLEAILKGEACE